MVAWTVCVFNDKDNDYFPFLLEFNDFCSFFFIVSVEKLLYNRCFIHLSWFLLHRNNICFKFGINEYEMAAMVHYHFESIFPFLKILIRFQVIICFYFFSFVFGFFFFDVKGVSSHNCFIFISFDGVVFTSIFYPSEYDTILIRYLPELFCDLVGDSPLMSHVADLMYLKT